MATVYLRSRSGRSLLQEKTAPADAAPYLPSQETIDRAISELGRLGFTIEAQGVTLSISGPSELFEQTCRPVDDSPKSPMRIAGLEHLIEGITPAIPGIPFGP